MHKEVNVYCKKSEELKDKKYPGPCSETCACLFSGFQKLYHLFANGKAVISLWHYSGNLTQKPRKQKLKEVFEQ